MIYPIKFNDLPNIAQLKAMFLDLENALEHDGKTWKYKRRSPHWTTAIRFDKYIHEKSKEFVLSLKPKNSVLTGKSVKQILEPHTPQKFLLQCDISRYFESISYEPLIKASLSKSSFDSDLLDKVETFYFDKNKVLRRGLRASAMLSEIMGLAIDNAVQKLMYDKRPTQLLYTRYYDDILISSDDKRSLREVEVSLTAVLTGLGLKINNKKSRLILVDNSRILGLRVHKRQIVVPKKFKRLARARAHHFDQLYKSMKQYDWEDETTLHEMKKVVGSVIGSYWHIVNNSDTDTSFEKTQIEEYMEALREFDSALDYLYSDEVIFH